MTSNNFDTSLAVPSTAATLAELRTRPMHPERAARFAGLSFGVLKLGEVPSAEPDEPYRAPAPGAPVVEERFGDAAHRRVAEELGLVRLGACFEAEASRTIKKEVWATRDGAVYASFTDPDRYHLGTYFDDGSCHVTWGHANPRTLTSPGFLVSTGGTGALRADLAAHVARVKDELESGRRFIQIDDIATAVELSRHYARQLTPLTLMAENDEVRRLNRAGRTMMIGLGVLMLVGLAAVVRSVLL